MGCIIISTVAYVVMKARVQSEFLAITITVAVAITFCVCVWQIFTQLENMVLWSELTPTSPGLSPDLAPTQHRLPKMSRKLFTISGYSTTIL